MMRLFKKKIVTQSYDMENKKPVIKVSICNGEQVAGFKDIHTGKIEEVMLIKSPSDLEKFKTMYGINEEITNDNMKTIRVVAAVILSEGKIFATQRGYGDFKGGWEFPGGKIEDGETPEVALKREISEELETKIRVGELIDTIEYDYPNFHLSMDCFWCEIVSGKLVLKEHEAARWLDKENLYSVKWLPADVSLIEKIALKL